MSKGSSEDDLCCCEYVNAYGDRTHILAFFCECDLIDDSFDRLFNKQQRPFPPGRFMKIIESVTDRLRIPYVGGAKKLSWDVVLPMIILPLWLYISTWGPYWTIIFMTTFPFLVRIVGKSLRKSQNCVKHFYFCFTILGIIFGHLTFELIIMPQMEITRREYVTNMVLLTVNLFAIYKTKSIVANNKDETEGSETHNYPHYYYCRSCEKVIQGRDHHCVWLNCCIGAKNRYWFIGFLLLCSIWIAYTSYLSLTSICYPTYLFQGKDYRYLLVPLHCPDAYNQFGTSLSFVASMYGAGVIIFLLAIATHQLRMLYKGMSYLDWKYGSKAEIVKSPQIKE